MSGIPNEQFPTTKQMAAYDNATHDLMRRIESMQLPQGFRPRYDMAQMAYSFRETFKTAALRQKVLSPRLNAQRIANANFSAGFCGIASYTWNHLFRMPNGAEIWRLRQAQFPISHDIKANHVWLENTIDGSILDLTFDQFVDANGAYMILPYEIGTLVDSHFNFNRAYIFAQYLNPDINLQDTVFMNTLKNSLGRY